MAVIDYGIIVLRDGKLLKENENLSQGTNGFFRVGDLEFGHTVVFNRRPFVYSYDDTPKFEPKMYIDFENALYYDKRHVLYWTDNTINYCTKYLDSSMYITTFKYNKGYYKVLQGHDVSLDRCYHRKSIKNIQKFLGKNNYGHLVLVK